MGAIGVRKLVVAVIALVVMSGVIAPRTGTVGTTQLGLGLSPAVAAHHRVGRRPRSTAPRQRWRRTGTRRGHRAGSDRTASSGPRHRGAGRTLPHYQATPVGTLWVGGGDHPGVDRVSVDAYLNGVALAGALGFEWRMVSAPAGSQAALTASDTASPVIQPDRPGTYDLQVTVRDRRAATSREFTLGEPVVLTAQPDDPPLWDPLRPCRRKPDGHIQIDDQAVERTTDPHGIYFAVLERRTEPLAELDTVPSTRQGVDRLDKVVDRWSRVGTLGHLMVVSSLGVGVSARSTRCPRWCSASETSPWTFARRPSWSIILSRSWASPEPHPERDR